MTIPSLFNRDLSIPYARRNPHFEPWSCLKKKAVDAPQSPGWRLGLNPGRLRVDECSAIWRSLTHAISRLVRTTICFSFSLPSLPSSD